MKCVRAHEFLDMTLSRLPGIVAVEKNMHQSLITAFKLILFVILLVILTEDTLHQYFSLQHTEVYLKTFNYHWQRTI